MMTEAGEEGAAEAETVESAAVGTGLAAAAAAKRAGMEAGTEEEVEVEVGGFGSTTAGEAELCGWEWECE
jgi:hypothetical protein